MRKTEQLHIRLSPADRQALDALSAERGQTRSAVVRELVLQTRPQAPRVEVIAAADRAGQRQEPVPASA